MKIIKDYIAKRWHLISEELYNKMREKYRGWWLDELHARSYLQSEVVVLRRAIKDACATGGDLCKYCQKDWTKCGEEFSCDCKGFEFNPFWEW